MMSGPGEAFLRLLSGTEFELGDRKVVGERSVFGVEEDRVGFGLGFKVDGMVIVI